MPLTTNEDIASLLRETRTIALTIASPKEHRTSNRILRYLLRQGYDVYPVNPGRGGTEIAGRKTFESLSDIPVPIDMVDIFRRSEFVGPIVQSAVEIGAKAIWMQLGVINEEAARRAEAAGLKVVMDDCPAMAIPRLEAEGLWKAGN